MQFFPFKIRATMVLVVIIEWIVTSWSSQRTPRIHLWLFQINSNLSLFFQFALLTADLTALHSVNYFCPFKSCSLLFVIVSLCKTLNPCMTIAIIAVWVCEWMGELSFVPSAADQVLNLSLNWLKRNIFFREMTN